MFFSDVWKLGKRKPKPDELIVGGIGFDVTTGKIYTKTEDAKIVEITKSNLNLTPVYYLYNKDTYDASTDKVYDMANKKILIDTTDKQYMVYREGFYQNIGEDYTVDASGITLTTALDHLERIGWIEGYL